MVYTQSMKRATLLIIVLTFVMPSLAFAQTVTELGAAPFGGVISQFYSISLRVVGLAVFIMFLIAGLSYILPDSLKPPFMRDPIAIIRDAVIGAILLFAAYVILNTINPALVRETGTLPVDAPFAAILRVILV